MYIIQCFFSPLVPKTGSLSGVQALTIDHWPLTIDPVVVGIIIIIIIIAVVVVNIIVVVIIIINIVVVVIVVVVIINIVVVTIIIIIIVVVIIIVIIVLVFCHQHPFFLSHIFLTALCAVPRTFFLVILQAVGSAAPRCAWEMAQSKPISLGGGK